VPGRGAIAALQQICNLSSRKPIMNFNAEQFAAASKANLDVVAGLSQTAFAGSSAWSN